MGLPQVTKGGDQTILNKADGIRGENMYSKGQRTLSVEGKANFDRIFGHKDFLEETDEG
jgi:hypothetical protein